MKLGRGGEAMEEGSVSTCGVGGRAIAGGGMQRRRREKEQGADSGI
jgi:hypothetical protein